MVVWTGKLIVGCVYDMECRNAQIYRIDCYPHHCEAKSSVSRYTLAKFLNKLIAATI